MGCGTRWGVYPNRRCPRVVCPVCGTAQCLSNGLGKGVCLICQVGLLPGWSHPERCRCGAQAQAVWLGHSYCLEHLTDKAKATAVTNLARRAELWEEVEE